MKHSGAYAWSLVGRTIPQIVLLLATMLLSRQLSAEVFGTVGVLSILYMVAGTILDSGLGGSLIKEQHITNDDCSTIFTFNLVLSVFLYLIIFIAAPTIQDFYSVSGLSTVTRVLSLILIVNAFGLVPNSLIIKDLQFKERTVSNIIASIVASIVAVYIAYVGGGVYALVALQIVQSLVNTILLHCFCRYPLSIGFSVESFKKLYKFGIFTTFVNVVDSIYENVLTSVCGKYLSIQQAGYLSQSKRIEEVASQSIFQTINSVSFPVLSKLSDNVDDFQREASQILKFVVLISFPPILILSLYSETIITLVFGSDWGPSAPYLSLLVFAALFIILENTNRNFIKSLGAVSSLLVFTVIKRTVGILIIAIFIISDASLMLWGYVISSAVGFLFNLLLYCKISGLSLAVYIRDIVVILTAPLCFFLINVLIVSLSDLLWLDILFTICTLILYYTIFIPLYGINIVKYIRNFSKSI